MRAAGVLIENATVDQAGEVLTVQRAAYVSEAQRYGDALLPPLTQSLAEIVEDIAAGRRFADRASSAAFAARSAPSSCMSAGLW